MSTYTQVHEPLWSQQLLLRPMKGELSQLGCLSL